MNTELQNSDLLELEVLTRLIKMPSITLENSHIKTKAATYFSSHLP